MWANLYVGEFCPWRNRCVGEFGRGRVVTWASYHDGEL